MRQLFLASLTLCLSSVALAHEGHGQGSLHSHATDFWGFIALGVLAAAAAWLSRK